MTIAEKKEQVIQTEQKCFDNILSEAYFTHIHFLETNVYKLTNIYITRRMLKYTTEQGPIAMLNFYRATIIIY